MSDEKLKPYGDIVTVTGKYEKDGVEKNRYHKVGTLFATPHFSRISIKLDSLPFIGEGWLSVYPREKKGSDASVEGDTITEADLPLGF